MTTALIQEKSVSKPISLPKKRINLWNPHKNQLKILDSQARYKVLVCGRQFGKTILSVNTLVKQALLHKDTKYWYVAPTYKQAKQIAWDILLAAVKKLPKELVIKVNESELFVILGNNSRIDIKGADNPDSLRGVALHGVVLDEYAFMRENVFTEIILPMFNTTNGWCIFVSTPKGFNHFYDLYIGAKSKDDWDTFHFTSYDNPYAQVAVLEEAKSNMSADRFAQEYMADFRKAEGLVYKEFDRDRHVITAEKYLNLQWVEVIAGIDFGYTNPSAIVVVGKDFDSRYFVIDEWYKTKKTTPEIAEVARNLEKEYRINAFYPDPAAAAHIEEINRLGLNLRETNKDVIKGIDSVRSLLKNNRLYIDARCKNLITEFESYSYPDTSDLHSVRNKNEPELPVKENDHALDALRYALFTNQPVQKDPDINFGLYKVSYS